jgi:hypothetical protein
VIPDKTVKTTAAAFVFGYPAPSVLLEALKELIGTVLATNIRSCPLSNLSRSTSVLPALDYYLLAWLVCCKEFPELFIIDARLRLRY